MKSSPLHCSLPTRDPPPPLQELNHLQATVQAPGAPSKKVDKAGDDGGDAVPDENKFDEFMGADGALLAGTTGEYDKDDREADEVWAQIDEFMDNRRRVCPCPRPRPHLLLTYFANSMQLS